MSELPRLFYVTTALEEPNAYQTWSAVLSPLFEPRPCGPSAKTPTGSAAGIIIGDLLIARVMFNAQNFLRDEERIRATPDHILFHLYTSGGFNGLINGQRTVIGPGKVAIIDLAHGVDTRAFSSNTLSLIVPRKLLGDLPLEALRPRLDPHRNDLLAAHIVSLRERSAQLRQADVEATVAGTVDFLKALLALNPEVRPAQMTEADDDNTLSLIEATIRDNLARPDLSPDWLAAQLDLSRASLYRLFASHGGIMRYVQERRLLAVQAALSDPLEMRRLSRLSADFGFKSEAHFSRSFRSRFGVTASDYRKAELAISARTQLTSPEVVQHWWTSVRG
ncbi:helix-turn-helix domain-containing protein [Bradyrhizobium sp. U87765 SZCCT0131]|uniref:helix-turn-helix domain-containing protein n=1 Tax=unclassified Bradyrhizobium TaxID=2631580 RepID=UPI001BA80248|nr:MULTISPECIES: helix-turn-helix domain-containing protein [unclassified Bradyrhizobium]MBR1217424.1 helix-turn-helix domain-containing protein [Bradyrhizobium sp. U87765 SZCCT0131]MBR1264979.1 helix-turn-helix domain-containing protein [Bradyrhizobium sp. U87765 SZCCT0134]MBR1304961.1 helix-turn-helix domain-containing protein [Bradyrhizobium sp. U87765 SZCCT0110]MBR1320747.1 helix-turn-helix domain-containing protein [Bradyrhizobium sp. U87765 SZCCT0109]MBR1349167.1 helix-turn-helix domain-